MVIYQILTTLNFLQRPWMKCLHREVMIPYDGRFRDGWDPLVPWLVWYGDRWSNQQFFAKIVLDIADVLYLMEIFPCPDIQKSIVSIPKMNKKKVQLQGCPIWIVVKVNEFCEYVFGARHFYLQIYRVSMCTFSFLE